MSRFDKVDVHNNWRHERVPEDHPTHPFPGIMMAFGKEDGRDVAVYVSDYYTKEDPIPEIMGKYLLDKGLDSIDPEDGAHLGMRHYYVTKPEAKHLLKGVFDVFKKQGINLLVILIGEFLKNKSQDLKDKTKKEIIHDIIDNIGDKVESDLLTPENIGGILDATLDF